MWYHWGALMINQFKGRDVLIFGGGEDGSGTEVLAYYSLNRQNECALDTTVSLSPCQVCKGKWFC